MSGFSQDYSFTKFIFHVRDADVDETMLEDGQLAKVLSWAIHEGRVHRLNQLVDPDLHFLWSQPQQVVLTTVGLEKAGEHFV